MLPIGGPSVLHHVQLPGHQVYWLPRSPLLLLGVPQERPAYT